MKLSEKIIEEWWKPWSVKLLGLATAISTLQLFMPDLQQALGPDWFRYAFGVILVARIIKQTTEPK